MADWTIGALMGAWLVLVLVAALTVMRSNRMTQDACARLMSALERTTASNSRVEAMYSSWRSDAVSDPFRPDRPAARAADDMPMSSLEWHHPYPSHLSAKGTTG